jgi:hypothetical protein
MKWSLQSRSAFPNSRATHNPSHADTSPIGAASNSLADILLCGVEFALARRLGLRRTVALFGVTEVALAVWIRDNLSLNVLMLMYPIDAVKEWQAAGH